jgi:hypothetical protein
MTEEQFYSLQNIYFLVAQIGSSFGSEDTSSGLVIPTDIKVFAEAIEQFLPHNYQVYQQEFTNFIKDFCSALDDPAIADFVAHITPLTPEFALVGGADFDPKGLDRGEFYLCLFLPTLEVAGTNVLICFSRAET